MPNSLSHPGAPTFSTFKNFVIVFKEHGILALIYLFIYLFCRSESYFDKNQRQRDTDGETERERGRLGSVTYESAISRTKVVGRVNV